ncbi:hypothetical protein G7Y89_g14434 [Cudoniella acicularis]|uniref:DUF7587 domain-containing protein n=1 Tax=Cudoniella acicularis TaxID=354080 RepID=A0A8H4VT87_9HELO|nr:hypothetical protein G7Y89_g14434 [Cudoniella acicularis]
MPLAQISTNLNDNNIDNDESVQSPQPAAGPSDPSEEPPTKQKDVIEEEGGLFFYEAKYLDNDDFYDITRYLRLFLSHIPKKHRFDFLDAIFTLDEKHAKEQGTAKKKQKYKPPHPTKAEEIEELFRKAPLPEESLSQRRNTRAAGARFYTRERELFPEMRDEIQFKASAVVHEPLLRPETRVVKVKPNSKKRSRAAMESKEEPSTSMVVQAPSKAVAEEKCEEDIHPWMPAPGRRVGTEHTEGALFRAWDQYSVCKIHDSSVGLQSGARRICLGTRSSRQRGLSNHAAWHNLNPTPFISATSSLDEIARIRVPHFNGRQANNSIKVNTRLTIINAFAQLAAGKPVLRMQEELDHYKVITPYGNQRNHKNSFYKYEYLLPFTVEATVIVGTWCWQDIERWMMSNGGNVHAWFRAIGRPSFEEHEAARKEGRKPAGGVGCACCGH